MTPQPGSQAPISAQVRDIVSTGQSWGRGLTFAKINIHTPDYVFWDLHHSLSYKTINPHCHLGSVQPFRNERSVPSSAWSVRGTRRAGCLSHARERLYNVNEILSLCTNERNFVNLFSSVSSLTSLSAVTTYFCHLPTTIFITEIRKAITSGSAASQEGSLGTTSIRSPRFPVRRRFPRFTRR